jgi:small subunit ribosomal protein S9|uniref:Small ribosomal subunit protein uS9c n=1 Tax=Dunaliella salina TaxID=3046 RepID=D0FY00_DUNSA|nr:ribosomal protein S9 [Dunaliella salina]ACS95086.1 ribosomal protein S9 [Dunaliella salina]
MGEIGKKSFMNILARSVGRRKEAVAQVQIVKGTNEAPGGQFIINNIPAENYLHNNTCSILSVKAPISILQSLHDASVEGENTDFKNDLGNFNTVVKVKGGGLVGQAEAIKLGLTRAICQLYAITPNNQNKSIREFPIENSMEESSKISSSGMSYETTIELRKQFKDKGFLTQDSRVKERRKYGLKKARKASQYHKR